MSELQIPRRLLFLVAGRNEVSCRFRVVQYLPHLRRLGIAADVADLHAPIGTRWRALRAASAYDAVCIHRAFLNPFELRWLRHAGAQYVFDFDDAIMFRDSSHRRFASWQRRARFRRMVAGARTVIAGNRYLAEWAARYSERVTTIPTGVDLDAYPAPRAPSREPVIGWIGTRSNLLYLKSVLPALTRVVRRRPDVRLKVVADDFVDLPGVQVTKKRWSLEDEVDDLASFQVGIMPLPDDPWTRGKCAVKILQYFAAGVPVVCSPVGTNRDVVEHGRTGYFATSEDEWVAHLEELLGNEERRHLLGAAGRDTVRRRYSIGATLQAFANTLLGCPGTETPNAAVVARGPYA